MSICFYSKVRASRASLFCYYLRQFDNSQPHSTPAFLKMPKRKRSSLAATLGSMDTTTILPNSATKRLPSKRNPSRRGKVDTNPDHNADIIDGKTALRASPDAEAKGEAFNMEKLVPKTPLKENKVKRESGFEDSDSLLSDVGEDIPSITRTEKPKKTPTKSSLAAKKGSDAIKAFKVEQAAKKVADQTVKDEEGLDEWDSRVDPDGDDVAPVENVSILKEEAARPPPVNSSYLPLPWNGRLGYVGQILL